MNELRHSGICTRSGGILDYRNREGREMMQTTGYCVPEWDWAKVAEMSPALTTSGTTVIDVTDPKELRRRELMKRERELWRVRR